MCCYALHGAPSLHNTCVERIEKGRECHIKCLQTYILVQHDAVVHDPVFIAEGERITVNVPKNAMKEGACMLLVQIPLGLYIYRTTT
jgi:hypothetical protein